MSLPIFHNFAAAAKAVAPYSHAVETDGWVFLTGQIPEEPGNEDAPAPAGIAAQTRRAMDNLALVLRECSLGWEHIVTARVFLTHFDDDYRAMNAVYADYFPEGHRPARTCIGVAALAHGVRIEIDCIARRP